jgi:molybdopterin converting factor small subunit
MAPTPSVVVEFYGMARRHAGRAEMRLDATTVAEALASAGLDGNLQVLVSINAGPFLSNLDADLKPGDRVLVMSPDAGG